MNQEKHDFYLRCKIVGDQRYLFDVSLRASKSTMVSALAAYIEVVKAAEIVERKPITKEARLPMDG